MHCIMMPSGQNTEKRDVSAENFVTHRSNIVTSGCCDVTMLHARASIDCMVCRCHCG